MGEPYERDGHIYQDYYKYVWTSAGWLRSTIKRRQGQGPPVTSATTPTPTQETTQPATQATTPTPTPTQETTTTTTTTTTQPPATTKRLVITTPAWEQLTTTRPPVTTSARDRQEPVVIP